MGVHPSLQSVLPSVGSSRLLALSLGLLLLSSCDFIVSGKGDNADPKKPTGPVAPTAASAPAKKVDPLDDAIAAQDEYVYNPIGLRDPFRTFLNFADGNRDVSPRTPLQAHDIEQYQLVGIIWGVDRPRALVQDPEGTGHVMEIGTYIGKNWGKVTQINSNEVIVTEEYQTIDGELVVNNISMTLPVAPDQAVQ